MPSRNLQLAIIVSAGLLLFIAAQWPKLAIPACVAMLVAIGFALRRMRSGAPDPAVRRNPWRRVAGIVIALALLFWALVSVRRG